MRNTYKHTSMSLLESVIVYLIKKSNGVMLLNLYFDIKDVDYRLADVTTEGKLKVEQIDSWKFS